MGYKNVSGCSWLLGGLFSFLASFFCLISLWPLSGWPSCLEAGPGFGGIFCVDFVAYCLSLLSFLIGVSLLFWCWHLNRFSRALLFLSVFFSVLCYCCFHSLWFWVFYELSIVTLLVLLATESPYSERYVALWYLVGYVVLGSLPMLVSLLFLSSVKGSFDFRLWSMKGSDLVLGLVCSGLGLLFITKIPLFPFHVWLPIVHAEASSPVSMCLSGYIMKLGLLGVYRFCSGLVSKIFPTKAYVLICLLSSVFFFLCAVRELDAKRWLAFFSLGHIVVAMLCFVLGGWKTAGMGFIYCLGHGLSAAAMFGFFWLCSCLSGSRKLLLLKHSLWGSLLFRVVFCLGVGTVCCIPPTVQFFSEVFLFFDVVWFSNYLFSGLFYVYVFLSGFTPAIFVCSLISRQYDVSYVSHSVLVPLGSVLFLLLWSFVLFFLC